MSSAAEAEIGALYINTRQLLPLRVTCEELEYPQLAPPIQTDNNTASGIIHGTFNKAQSKAKDKYYWLINRAQQTQFKIYWDKGIQNLVDYSSKYLQGGIYCKR